MNEIMYFGIAIFLSWTVSQALKVWWDKDWNIWSFLLRRGGRFSSHSAVIVSTSSTVYFLEGFSTLFLVTVALSFLIYAEIVDRKRHGEAHTFMDLVRGGLVGLGIALSFIYFFSGSY
jgi:acid phosphatase family membrane protein YuiD